MSLYDSFAGPELDSNKWWFLQYPIPGGEPWVCREPGSRLTISDGTLSVDIDQFQLEHAAQPIDNCKFVIMSTESFAVPSSGTLVVRARMSGSGKGTVPFDWRDGFASLVVFDPSTGLVFDVVATAESVGAIHERVQLTPEMQWFTHVIEAPLLDLEVGPDRIHDCEIVLNRSARTAHWTVDGREVYRARDIEVPESVMVGMGVFTLRPVRDGRSQSLHGQGFRATWSDVSVAVTP